MRGFVKILGGTVEQAHKVVVRRLIRKEIKENEREMNYEQVKQIRTTHGKGHEKRQRVFGIIRRSLTWSFTDLLKRHTILI